MKKSLREWWPQSINARMQWNDGVTTGGNKFGVIIREIEEINWMKITLKGTQNELTFLKENRG